MRRAKKRPSIVWFKTNLLLQPRGQTHPPHWRRIVHQRYARWYPATLAQLIRML